MRILLDGGAYASSSTAVISNACSFAVGPYAVDNVLIDGLCVYTNNPPCGAMRGFGAVQSCFAAEAQMDKLAAELEIDPVELRLLNALEPGGSAPDGPGPDRLAPDEGRDPARRGAAGPRAGGAPARRDPAPGRRGQHDARRRRATRRRLRGRVQERLLLGGFDDYCTARVVLGADGRRDRPLRVGRGRPGRLGGDPPGRATRARHGRRRPSRPAPPQTSARRAPLPRRG